MLKQSKIAAKCTYLYTPTDRKNCEKGRCQIYHLKNVFMKKVNSKKNRETHILLIRGIIAMTRVLTPK